MMEIVAFLRERESGISVEVGELRHRDLRGNAVNTSQMYPSQMMGGGSGDETDDGKEETEQEDEEEEERNPSHGDEDE